MIFHHSKGMMLPVVVASLVVLLIFAPNSAVCQEAEEPANVTSATPSTTSTTTTSTTSATPVEITTPVESTTSTITTPPPSPETSTSESAPSPSSAATPEGSLNSPCNATLDCQPNKNLECMEGVCHCPDPQIFDLRLVRCVIPLGKLCDSSDIIGENMCPESAECFMDRCVCKTGYSMHTLTRCKSDLIDPESERKSIVLWPPQQSGQAAKSKEEDVNSSSGCTPETCEESKGVICQETTCTCKDSREIFVEEFGRCLNTTLQQTLKDALSIVTTSEDEIKSLVKLLEKVDDVDQEIGGSDHYNSPVHQLLGLLGGDDYRATQPSSISSQVAPPYSNYGDLHSAAQEPQSTFAPSSGSPTLASSSSGGGSAPGGGSIHTPPESHISPVSTANAESSTESGEALPYSSESMESVRRPGPSLPLDNLQYSPQSQEPNIVQRQAPPYSQGGLGGFGGQGSHGQGSLAGYGDLGGFGHGGGGLNHGLGGFGGYGGFGGHHGGGFGGLGGHLGGQYGLGGHGGGLSHLGGGQHGGGFGGGHNGGGLSHLGGGHNGGGLGHLGGHHGGGLDHLGGHHGGGLGHLGGGLGGHHGGAPPGGGGGGHEGGHGGGHHAGPVGPHHGPGHHEPPPKEGLLIDVAEFVGRSLKLMDRFLPLVHAINDVLKKEGIFDKKEKGLFGALSAGPEGPRGRRFGDISKEFEELKEGGDGTLKKLLA